MPHFGCVSGCKNLRKKVQKNVTVFFLPITVIISEKNIENAGNTVPCIVAAITAKNNTVHSGRAYFKMVVKFSSLPPSFCKSKQYYNKKIIKKVKQKFYLFFPV